jgi:hypothetical protein
MRLDTVAAMLLVSFVGYYCGGLVDNLRSVASSTNIPSEVEVSRLHPSLVALDDVNQNDMDSQEPSKIPVFQFQTKQQTPTYDIHESKTPFTDTEPFQRAKPILNTNSKSSASLIPTTFLPIEARPTTLVSTLPVEDQSSSNILHSVQEIKAILSSRVREPASDVAPKSLPPPPELLTGNATLSKSRPRARNVRGQPVSGVAWAQGAESDTKSATALPTSPRWKLAYPPKLNKGVGQDQRLTREEIWTESIS